MHNKFSYLFLASFLFCAHQSLFSQEQAQPTQKKKILILWSNGGGAHKSMLNALTTYLKNDYEIIPFKPIETVWSMQDIGNDQIRSAFDGMIEIEIASFLPRIKLSLNANKAIDETSEILDVAMGDFIGEEGVETIKDFIAGKTDGDDFYNLLITKNLYKIANLFYKKSLKSFKKNHAIITERFLKKFNEIKPDLIVSLIPLYNQAALEASQKANVPFLLLAPDFDITNYFLGEKTHYKCPCGLAFNDSMINSRAEAVGVHQEDIKIYGMPLRQDFFEIKNRSAIRREFNIPEDKKVVMILMGGAGSHKVVDHVYDIVEKIKQPVHIIACVGRDKEVERNLKTFIQLPQNITLSVIGFTDRISDIMAAADVLITKPGPATLCEAIQSKLPIILDCSAGVLDWEKPHVEFFKKHNLGSILHKQKNFDDPSYKNLSILIETMLSDDQYLNEIRQQMSTLATPFKDYEGQVKSLIQHMIENKEIYVTSSPFSSIISSMQPYIPYGFTALGGALIGHYVLGNRK